MYKVLQEGTRGTLARGHQSRCDQVRVKCVMGIQEGKGVNGLKKANNGTNGPNMGVRTNLGIWPASGPVSVEL